MRIIRNHDDDHEHDDEGREPRDPKALGEILADEVSDYLAAAAQVRGAPFPLGQDAPIEAAVPQPLKPALRLVKTDDTDNEPGAAAPAGTGIRPRLLRAGLGGSLLVIAAVALTAWGQPAIVAIPLAGYGLGWIAYLWWNAAWRPPIPQVLTVLLTAIGRGIAALVRGTCTAVRRGVDRIEALRTRHESRRTANA